MAQQTVSVCLQCERPGVETLGWEDPGKWQSTLSVYLQGKLRLREEVLWEARLFTCTATASDLAVAADMVTS